MHLAASAEQVVQLASAHTMQAFGVEEPSYLWPEFKHEEQTSTAVAQLHNASLHDVHDLAVASKKYPFSQDPHEP